MYLKKLNITKKKVFFVVILIIIIGVFAWLGTSFNPVFSDIEQIIRSYGSLGPLILVCVYVLTIVFSPLAGTPLIVAGLAIFGFYETFLYIYISNLMGATINFFIARKFGRPLVKKFVGEKDIKEIDDVARIAGVNTLILFRLLGGGSFDFISYAAGLTAMNFGVYILITILASIPSTFAFIYTLDKAINLPLVYSLPLFILIYIMLVVIPTYVYRRQKRRIDQEKSRESELH